MPHLDGFALTRKVKQEISLFKGAVVGCTAEDSRLAAEQALQAGMDKVIYKPYTLANLRKVSVVISQLNGSHCLNNLGLTLTKKRSARRWQW
uniref:response regulator n=1 Tax=Vibrio cholerae TaxID=666 RepID=UPI003F58ECC1